MSVVLVTGGAGFIGSHVVDHLEAAGHEPRIFDVRPSPWHDPARVASVVGDIRDVDEITRALEGCDAVCHLAAAADVGEVHADPVGATELNSLGTLNVLEAARRAGVTRVVYASTVWVYSDVKADSVDEETPLEFPAHLYTATKLSGEMFCNSYAELYGLEPTILRFGIPYGPRARPAAVIPAFVGRALAGEALTIAGAGDQERTFVYVEDLADGVVRALAPHAIGRTYDLAGRETVTVRQLADIVREEVAPIEIVHTEGRAGDLRGAAVPSERAESELGWRATTPLREGVRRYAEWVRDQRPAAPALAELAPRRSAALAATSRRAQAALVARAADPVYVGAVAMTAVASAGASVMLGTHEESQAASLAVVGVAALMPLWALSASAWPRERRRLQSLLTVLAAVAGIVLLGVLSAGAGTGLDHHKDVLVLGLSATLATALRMAARRLAPDAASERAGIG